MVLPAAYATIALTGWLLVEAENVSRGIAEARGDFRRVRANGLHEFAALGHELIDSRGHAVDHDIDEQSGRRRRRPARDPCPAHLAHSIVEGEGAVTPLSGLPTKNLFVEFSRALDVARGYLDVADFAVTQSWSHRSALTIWLN